MNVNKLNALVPTSFKCECVNDEGEMEMVEIKIWLNRFSFKTITQDDLIKGLQNIDKDPQVIGNLLEKLVGKWELFTDDSGKEMLPITADTIIDQPFDFVVNLANAVVLKLFPNPQKALNSEGGSVQAERSIDATKILNDATNSQSQAASGE